MVSTPSSSARSQASRMVRQSPCWGWSCTPMRIVMCGFLSRVGTGGDGAGRDAPRVPGVATAIVPLKRLDQAKTRLAEVLSPPERRQLMEALLGDVLGVLRAVPQIDRVVVASSDPGAAAIAARYDAACLS